MKTCRKCQQPKSPLEFPRAKATRDQLSSWCRACHADASKQWRDKSGYNEARSEQRRAELRGRSAFRSVAEGSDEDAYLLAVAKDPCAYCGMPATDLDHIVPGVDDVENVTAACGTCNKRKQQLSLLGFLVRRRLIDEGYDEFREQWKLAA